MLTEDNYDLVMYIIGRLIEEDPDPESESGKFLSKLTELAKEYEEKILNV